MIQYPEQQADARTAAIGRGGAEVSGTKWGQLVANQWLAGGNWAADGRPLYFFSGRLMISFRIRSSALWRRSGADYGGVREAVSASY